MLEWRYYVRIVRPSPNYDAGGFRRHSLHQAFKKCIDEANTNILVQFCIAVLYKPLMLPLN